MASRLFQILTFANVGAGQTATVAHNINVNGTPVLPDFLYPDTKGFSLVSATTTAITVRNDGSSPATLQLALQRVHSSIRALGPSEANLTPQPFWVSGGAPDGGGGGVTPGFIPDPSNSGGVVQNNNTGNVATGANSIAGGDNSSAAAGTSVALGSSNTAAGADYSLAVGTSNVGAGSQYASAIGNSDVGNNSSYSTALGNSEVGAGSQYASAIGNSIASGESATALGAAEASGEAATAFGYGEAAGDGATAGGLASATGDYATAFGDTSVLANYATAFGSRARATREGEFAHASGQFADMGDAQWSVVVLRGETPGAEAGETVELKFGENGDQELTLVESNTAYALEILAVAKSSGSEPGNRVFRQTCAAWLGGFGTVGVDAGEPETLGTLSGQSWTLTVSGASGKIVVEFSTGEDTAAVKCVAYVRLVKVTLV